MLCSKIPRSNQLHLNETKEGTGKITKEQRNKDTGYWFSREPDAVISNKVCEKRKPILYHEQFRFNPSGEVQQTHEKWLCLQFTKSVLQHSPYDL